MKNRIFCDDIHSLVDAFAAALDAKNSCMQGHSERVADISLALSRELDLPLDEQSRIHIGAHLHDIGKIGIPDCILNKNGKLTKMEFALIRRHPAIGSDIIGRVRILESVTDIVRHHHERFDGGGYPDGLAGEQISMGARIVAVADAFDAMTSPRTYRQELAVDEALNEMRRCRGGQFDSGIVTALVNLIKKSGDDFRLLLFRSDKTVLLNQAAGFGGES